MRIVVIGAPGSGKSRLGGLLAEATGLPLYRLDDHYWADSWTRPAPEVWRARTAGLLRAQDWIIEGNHADSLAPRVAAADLVLLLDVGPVRSVLGLLRRTTGWALGRHASLPAAIRSGSRTLPPAANLWSLLRKSATFRRRVLPGMLAELATAPCPVIVLRSRRAAGRVVPAVRARMEQLRSDALPAMRGQDDSASETPR